MEQPKFNHPNEMPKPRNQGLEQYIEKVYQDNPEALSKKEELVAMLNADSFDGKAFRDQIDEFEKETLNSKGYNGQQTAIETIRGKNGTLSVYHVQGSNTVRFGYGDLKE